MWDVSDRFLNAISYPHRTATEVTFTPPGGEPHPVRIKDGYIEGDSRANIARTANLRVFGRLADYETLATPGGVLQINHGINFGNERELVPVFNGELIAGGQELGDGTITARFADLNVRVARSRFLTPYAPTGTRPSVIEQVVTGAVPDASVVNQSSDTGMVSGAVWDESRLDVIRDLTSDGDTDAFWRPDGTFMIRDRLTESTPPVWTIAAGRNGTLKPGAARARPMDKLYNTVVVRPSATDGSQEWEQQVVQITDPTHPRHPDKIGVVPYFWASPTASTAVAALSAAGRILAGLVGSTDSLTISSISNAALAEGDPIRILTPAIGSETPKGFVHYIDTFRLDLRSGSMVIATRSQVADA